MILMVFHQRSQSRAQIRKYMDMTEVDNVFHFILTHKNKQEILVLPTSGGWTLPLCQIAINDGVDLMDTDTLNGAVREQFGINVTKLYALETRYAEDRVKIGALENHTDGWQPPAGSRWVNHEYLRKLHFARPILKSVAEAWFMEEKEGHVVRNLTPWVMTGWFDEATEWILDQLQRLGIRNHSPVKQVKSFYTAGTLRINTDVGYVYFKALPHVFVRELETMNILAKWSPERVPIMMASDPERRWMLQQDIGGRELFDISDIDVWADALREYARLQIQSLGFLDELLNGPAYDYRLATMASAIDPMLMNIYDLLHGYQPPISELELSEIQFAAPQLRDMCFEVESYGVPCTLEHGDLHPGNIRITENGTVFFDWAWSYITHPFLGAVGLLYKASKYQPGIAEASLRLRDDYLEVWTEYGTMEQLRELFSLIDRWRVIHAAITDAEWVAAYQGTFSGDPPQYSFTEWALRRRQYYLAKVLRRLPGCVKGGA